MEKLSLLLHIFFLVNFFALKSLSYINIATHILNECSHVIFFYPFINSLVILLYLKCVSYKEHRVGLWFLLFF